jgi:hypothetical protein
MLFVVSVVSISPIHEGAGDLPDSVQVNEEKSHDGQRGGGGDRACGRTAQVRGLACDQGDDFAKGNLAEEVGEEDEEEEGPEEGDETVGVFLECRAEDFDAEELEDRLEEVARAGGGILPRRP